MASKTYKENTVNDDVVGIREGDTIIALVNGKDTPCRVSWTGWNTLEVEPLAGIMALTVLVIDIDDVKEKM